VLAYTTMLWQDVENLHAPDSLIMAKTSPPGVHQTSIFECANGEWMHAGVNVGRVATSTMEEILGVEAADQTRLMADPAYRLAHINTLRAAFIHRDRTELCKTFFDAGVGADPILSPVEMYSYPQFRANNMAVQVDDPELGVMTQVGIAPVLLGTPGSVQGPRPVVGADTRKVLTLAGFASADIDNIIQSSTTGSTKAGK
jgi:crotonobetainyl-CoA:carnitine CoA-transferase CaiB-like acyl-CoA transferase